MTAHHPRSALSPSTRLQRYTLIFKNGEQLRHQDPISLLQYQSDARLAAVHPEPEDQPA